MSLSMQDDMKEPVWADVKDLPSAFVDRKTIVARNKQARRAKVLAKLQPQPQHKDVLPADEREPV